MTVSVWPFFIQLIITVLPYRTISPSKMDLHLTYGSFSPLQSAFSNPKGISISSAVFARLTNVINKYSETDRHTDHTTLRVAIGRYR